MRFSFDVIQEGRDRVRAVLAPLLGRSLALERANNIAQALVLGSADPQEVAFQMLRHVGVPDVPAVAAEVGRAWRSSLPPHAPGSAAPTARGSVPPPGRGSVPPPERGSVPPPGRGSVPPPERGSIPPPGL